MFIVEQYTVDLGKKRLRASGTQNPEAWLWPLFGSPSSMRSLVSSSKSFGVQDMPVLGSICFPMSIIFLWSVCLPWFVLRICSCLCLAWWRGGCKPYLQQHHYQRPSVPKTTHGVICGFHCNKPNKAATHVGLKSWLFVLSQWWF